MGRMKTWLTVFAVALASLCVAPGVWAERLADAEVIIEINDTDGDAGIHMSLDATGWKRMKAFDPDGNKVFDIKASGSVGVQGMTELFFESAEPSFDEQPLADFLALFPEGKYRFEGTTTEGVPLRGSAILTHALPAAPVLVTPVEDDDEVDPDDTVVEWLPVADPPGSKIVGYEVIVADEDSGVGEFSATVSRNTTSVTVPPEVMKSGTAYKFEVLAIEKSGNQTISEREFETE